MQVTLVNTLRKALNFGQAKVKLNSDDASQRLAAVDILENNLDDVAGGDGERPLAQLAQGIEIGLAELQLVDGALGALQQSLPRLGQPKRAALDELDPGGLLQVLEVQAHIGLRHVQFGGRLAEVLQPGQGDEGVQPVNVQHGVPLLPGRWQGQRRQGTGTTQGSAVSIMAPELYGFLIGIIKIINFSNPHGAPRMDA